MSGRPLDEPIMSLFTQPANGRPDPLNHAGGTLRDLAAALSNLYREWDVRRQMARAQMLDGASLRDIGVAAGGLESAIRHGR
jgi:hypothetical protein